mmetsp:Transcript_69671/g.123338  ORF Transcript_69671/g.123338 Transcript_69671/m.123338 type:complete len:409 (+) Transcript_69671:81-1307(+)
MSTLLPSHAEELIIEDWPRKFLETDGFGYVEGSDRQEKELSPEPREQKWWHVPDDRISEIVEDLKVGRRPGRTKRASPAGPADLTDRKEASASPTSTMDGEVSDDQKKWKVSDDQIDKLINELRRNHENEKPMEDITPYTSPRKRLDTRCCFQLDPLQPPRVQIRIRLLETGDTLYLRVPPDLPIMSQEPSRGPVSSLVASPRYRSRQSHVLEKLSVDLVTRGGARDGFISSRDSETASSHHGGIQVPFDSLKGIIEFLTTVKPDDQLLYFKKHILQDPKTTLEDYGINDMDELLMAVQRKPGQKAGIPSRVLTDLSRSPHFKHNRAGGEFYMMPRWRWDANPSLFKPSGGNESAGLLTPREFNAYEAFRQEFGDSKAQEGLNGIRQNMKRLDLQAAVTSQLKAFQSP